MSFYCELCEKDQPDSHDHTVERRQDPHQHKFGENRGWYDRDEAGKLKPGWSKSDEDPKPKGER